MYEKLTKHLEEQNQTYFEHLRFALRASFFLFACFIFLLIHAFIPFFRQPKGFDLYGIQQYIKHVIKRKGSVKS